jgi:hypothetical protein
VDADRHFGVGPMQDCDAVQCSTLLELGSEQPIKCEFEMNGAPYPLRLNHAAALPSGKPLSPAE